MPHILMNHTLPDGHALLVIEAASRGGTWRHPVCLRLVETDGTPYTHARARNVIRVIAVEHVDGRYTGPRSGYHAAMVTLGEQLREEAAAYRPGAPVPADAVVVTEDMLADLPPPRCQRRA